jgi:hypothetical protein
MFRGNCWGRRFEKAADGGGRGKGACGVHVAKIRFSVARLRRTDQGAHYDPDRADGVVRLLFWRAPVGVSSWSLGLFHALLGVALVSSGTAALNEVLEASVDARMRRTALRPLPAGRMTTAHAAIVGLALTLGGSVYLAIYANLLTGLLVFLTAWCILRPTLH